MEEFNLCNLYYILSSVLYPFLSNRLSGAPKYLRFAFPKIGTLLRD